MAARRAGEKKALCAYGSRRVASSWPASPSRTASAALASSTSGTIAFGSAAAAAKRGSRAAVAALGASERLAAGSGGLANWAGTAVAHTSKAHAWSMARS